MAGQVDLPAPERADRHPGPDGQLRAGRAPRIGVVDRLFSRVGAADDLARGRSTFMVEMVETAVILNQAGPRALVILDEIGRGTATFDGLSIAWAALEHLHEVNRCRALFATHYPRADLADGQAAGARLPRHAGQGMAGRGRLPARGRRRRRRPLLRHPRRQAGRPARRRGPPRRGGPGEPGVRASRPAAWPAWPTTCRSSPPRRRRGAEPPPATRPPRNAWPRPCPTS